MLSKCLYVKTLCANIITNFIDGFCNKVVSEIRFHCLSCSAHSVRTMSNVPLVGK